MAKLGERFIRPTAVYFDDKSRGVKLKLGSRILCHSRHLTVELPGPSRIAARAQCSLSLGSVSVQREGLNLARNCFGSRDNFEHFFVAGVFMLPGVALFGL